jgi:hypothetical protein
VCAANPQSESCTTRPTRIVAESGNTSRQNDRRVDFMPGTRVRISIGDHLLTAELGNNATADALRAMLPLSLEMADLYDHELVHRFLTPLPVDDLIERAPERGDIVYWAPRNALVLFYADRGELLSELQPIGRVVSGIDSVDHPGDVRVSFDLI